MSEGLDFSQSVIADRAAEAQEWQRECMELRQENEVLREGKDIRLITYELRRKVRVLADLERRWQLVAARLSLRTPGLDPQPTTPELFLSQQIDGTTELLNKITKLEKEVARRDAQEIADVRNSSDCPW